MEVTSVPFSPTKENQVHRTKILTETDKHGFSPAVFRSRVEQKTPFTELMFFLWRDIRKGWVAVFVSVAITCSFALRAARISFAHCFRVSSS